MAAVKGFADPTEVGRNAEPERPYQRKAIHLKAKFPCSAA